MIDIIFADHYSEVVWNVNQCRHYVIHHVTFTAGAIGFKSSSGIFQITFSNRSCDKNEKLVHCYVHDPEHFPSMKCMWSWLVTASLFSPANTWKMSLGWWAERHMCSKTVYIHLRCWGRCGDLYFNYWSPHYPKSQTYVSVFCGFRRLFRHE